MSSAVPSSFPVLIVGAGPVGMMLALDLAARGVRSLVVERAHETLWYPKGNTHNARTMEHYRRLGLADQVRATGLPADHPTDVAYFTSLAGYELQRLPMPSTNEKLTAVAEHDVTDQVPEPLHRSNQMYVERMLATAMQAAPLIDCRFGVECTSLEAGPEGVVMTVQPTDGGPEEHVGGGYLVGCDGPKSLVRKMIGGTYQGEDAREQGFMSGLTHSTHLRIPALHNKIISRPAWQYWVLRPNAVSNFVNLDAGDEFLFHAVMGDQTGEEAVRRLVIDCIGEAVDVEVIAEQEWIAGRALVSDTYGSGRVLLCGDAVHLFTPTGGFGMNTGVDDAANLAWKLAATLSGWAGPGLLDSYQVERRPIAVRNTRKALGLARSIKGIPLGTVLEEDSDAGRDARAIAADVLAGFAEEFASLGIQLGARYDGSPVVTPDGTSPPPDDPTDYAPSACPGGRAPHVWLDGDRSLFDAFGPGFTLLRLGSRAPEGRALTGEAAARGVPLTVLDVPLDAGRDLYERDLALIRPDQHVAWRGNTLPDAASLLDTVTGR